MDTRLKIAAVEREESHDRKPTREVRELLKLKSSFDESNAVDFVKRVGERVKIVKKN